MDFPTQQKYSFSTKQKNMLEIFFLDFLYENTRARCFRIHEINKKYESDFDLKNMQRKFKKSSLPIKFHALTYVTNLKNCKSDLGQNFLEQTRKGSGKNKL